MKDSYEKKFKEFLAKRIPFSKDSIAGLEIGNVLVAICTTGMMALGVLPMSLPTLITFAIILLILGIIGRYMDEVQDDKERLKIYEEYLISTHLQRGDYENTTINNASASGSNNLHTSVFESENSRDGEARVRGGNCTRKEN